MRRFHSKKSGFTLVEFLIVVIILGILAAIVIPQFTNASTDARKSNLTSQLQTLRSQIQLYKLQHLDTVPDLVTNWNPFLDASKQDGTLSNTATPTVPDATFTFGPYVPAPVVNPLTNSSTCAAAAAAGVGWVYNTTSGEIHGVNAAGAQSDDGN